MKIVEGSKNLELDLPPMGVDKTFTVYDKKKKKYIKADWIKKTGLPPTHSVLIYYGCCGSGKSSLMTSLITSKKPASRVYRGCFDRIYICADYSSIRSLAGDPFGDIPEEQFFHTFNESFLQEITETVKENSDNDLDSLVIIDDSVNRLKRLADPLCNFLLVHRHLKCTTHILAQDICQVPLSVRSNLTGGFFFKQSNQKRIQLLREEYMSFMSNEEYKKFEKFCWNKKGDVLYISFKLPFRYYKNFKEITFEELENSTNKMETNTNGFETAIV